MAPGEYYPVKVSARLIPSGKVLTPTLLERERKQRISLPTRPLVGEVIGLAVMGEQGVIQRFEMQVTKPDPSEPPGFGALVAASAMIVIEGISSSQRFRVARRAAARPARSPFESAMGSIAYSRT